MSSADQDVSTGGGTGTGVQTIVKDKLDVKKMEEVRMKSGSRVNDEPLPFVVSHRWVPSVALMPCFCSVAGRLWLGRCCSLYAMRRVAVAVSVRRKGCIAAGVFCCPPVCIYLLLYSVQRLGAFFQVNEARVTIV